MKELSELLGDKEDAMGGGESDMKMQVLKELRQMAMDMMGDKMPGAAKAEMEMSVEAPESSLSEAMEMAPEMAEEDAMGEDMELDEIEAQIRELEELRRAKMMKA